MTLTAREPAHTATRAVHRVGDNLATLGMHVSFYVRTIASIPYALSKFRKHVIAQISEVSFGTQSLLSGGGTIGIVFAIVIVGGVGDIVGALLAGMAVMAVAGLVSLWSPVATPLVVFSSIVVALLFRPQGLFARRGR